MKFRELFDTSHDMLFDLYDLNDKFIAANYYSEQGEEIKPLKDCMDYEVVKFEARIYETDTEPTPEENRYCVLAVQLKLICIGTECKRDSDVQALRSKIDRLTEEVIEQHDFLIDEQEKTARLTAENLALKAKLYDLMNAQKGRCNDMFKDIYTIQYKLKGERHKHDKYKDFDDLLYFNDEADMLLEHINENDDYIFRKHKVGSMDYEQLMAKQEGGDIMTFNIRQETIRDYYISCNYEPFTSVYNTTLNHT